jgi:RNA polymerase sigma-70 factor (ECF subfamily)
MLGPSIFPCMILMLGLRARIPTSRVEERGYVDLRDVALTTDEHALVAAAAGGDSACFERLYSLYERRVFHYVRGFVRDASVAEEVVIDTMLAVWVGAGRFNQESRVSTWILGIARHKALDAVRRMGRVGPRVSLHEAADLATSAAGPEDLAQQRALVSAMEDAFGQLSSEHREILHLAFFEDLAYGEIASLLSLPVNTVKTRVYYAKQKLKAEMERHTLLESEFL